MTSGKQPALAIVSRRLWPPPTTVQQMQQPSQLMLRPQEARRGLLGKLLINQVAAGKRENFARLPSRDFD